jgi:hypothetical protein
VVVIASMSYERLDVEAGGAAGIDGAPGFDLVKETKSLVRFRLFGLLVSASFFVPLLPVAVVLGIEGKDPQAPGWVVALFVAVGYVAIIAAVSLGYSALRLFMTSRQMGRALHEGHQRCYVWTNPLAEEAAKARAFAAEEWGPAAEQRDDSWLVFTFNSYVPPLRSQWKVREWLRCRVVRSQLFYRS